VYLRKDGKVMRDWNDLSNEEKYKKAYAIYKECRGIFGNILDDWSDFIEDEEERGFYHVVSNYFLQQRQKDVIEKGLF
jgi:hypothetical protein